MSVWFTSDHHFGHARVIGYSERPFQDVAEMTEGFVQAWNAVVKPGDVVYHLGDFAFLKAPEVATLVKRLRGQIQLVRGNHDRFVSTGKFPELGFVWIGDYKEIKIDGQLIVLCHYPFLTWRNRHHGSWCLHGHCHGTLTPDPDSKRLDVSVDNVAKLYGRAPQHYRPLSYEEVADEMKRRGISPVDHHERRGGEDGAEE